MTPYEEGYTAFKEGKSFTWNPYSLENDDYEYWYRGWRSGFAEQYK